MRIIMPTCDKYRNVIEAHKYTCDKFGGKELDITILGYKKPNFDLGKWKFLSLGIDTGPQNFTNDIWKFFKDFDDEYFIYAGEDIVVVDNLDLKLLDDMTEKMKKNPNIAKICLTSAANKNYNPHRIFERNSDHYYIELDQNAEYRLSLHYGIWRTSYFKKYFQFNISPWDWELRNIAKNDGAIILGTVGRHFLDFGHIYRKGNRITDNWYMSEYTGKSLSKEDIIYTQKIINNN